MLGVWFRARGALSKMVLLACLCAMLSPLPASPLEDASDPEATLLFNTAGRLYRQESWRDAAEAFGEFLERFPRHPDAPEARFARGYSLHRLGRHEEALEDLRAASKDGDARWAADAAFSLGRSLEALAVALPEGSPGRRKQLKEAAAGYARAADLRRKALADAEPRERSALLDLHVQAVARAGESLYRAGEHERAARALEPVLRDRARLENAARYPRALYFLALSRYALERRASASDDNRPDHSGSIECLEILASRSFEQDPLWPEAVYLLARILQHSGDESAAIEHYGRLVEKGGPRAPEALYERGLAYYDRGARGEERESSFERAARDLRAFREKHPEHDLVLQARYYEALSRFHRGDYPGAREHLASFLDRAVSDETAAELIARALLALGQACLLGREPDPEAAARALTLAIERASKDPERPSRDETLAGARFWRAEARLRQASGEEDGRARDLLLRAARDFQEVARSAVSDLAEEALHRRADALFRAGEHRAAAEVAARYRREHPAGEGRFHVDSLELSARNALGAPEGALSESERRNAPEYYVEAADLVAEPEEKLRFRYLSGVAFYHAGRYIEAEKTLEAVVSELRRGRHRDARKDYPELPFFLADSIAQQREAGRDEGPDRARLRSAAKLFENYLEDLPPEGAGARHAATARINRGLCYQWAGDAARARDAFRDFLEKHPDHALVPRVRFSLASASLELEDMAAARAAYREAAEGTEDVALAARALLQAASIERRLGDPRASLRLLERAIQRLEDGGSPAARSLLADARYERAMALVEDGETGKARRALERFLRDHRRSEQEPRARIQLAHLLLEDGEPAAALMAVERLAKSRPGEIAGRDEALYLVAWAHGALAREGKADEKEREEHLERMAAAYREVVEDHPDTSVALDARLELAQHFFNAGEPEKAKRWFRELRGRLEASAGSEGADDSRRSELLGRALYGLGFLAFEEKDYGGARALFDDAAEHLGGDLLARAVFQSGRSWMLGGGEAEAVRRFERLTGELKHAAGEHGEEALLRLGECLHRLREYGEAVKVLTGLLEEFPEGKLRHEARLALGFALQYRNRFDDAVKELRGVVAGTRAPVAARAQYHIGECFMDRREYRQAAREFLTVAANFDFDGPYREWFRRSLLAAGIAYRAAGDKDAARKQWEELVERFPDSTEAEAAKKRLEEARE